MLTAGDEHGFDVEGESGKLEVLFEDEEETKFVISPNTPVREIWISALSTSFKLGWSEAQNAFVLEKTGENLHAVMARVISQQLGTRLRCEFSRLIAAWDSCEPKYLANSALVIFSACWRRRQRSVPSPRDVVSPEVYVSAEPAARGVPFQVAVVFKIRPGFHVNAREKSADYLIATDLRAEMPAGFKAGVVSFIRKDELHTFTFSKKPLNVYQGTVTLRMPLTALASAPARGRNRFR